MKHRAALGILLILLAGQARGQTARLTLDTILNTEDEYSSDPGVLSPDGRYFALAVHGHIELLPTDGTAPHTLPNTPSASELAWSPDSQHLAFIAEGDVWTVALNSATATRLTHDPAGPGDPRGATDHHPEWNPKSDWILYQSGRKGFNELYVVSTDGKTENLLAPTEIYTGADVIAPKTADHGDAVSSDRFNPVPAWSPDGAHLAFTERSRAFFSGKLKVLAFNPQTGTCAAQPKDIYIAKNDPGGAWAVETGSWSPDSGTIAVVLQQSGWDKIWLIPATGGEPTQLTTGPGEDEDPVYSPDGKWIAFTSNRDLPEEQHLWLIPSTGGEPHRLTPLKGVEDRAQWSADSQHIYFSHGTAQRLPSTYVASLTPISGHPIRPLQPSIYEQLGIQPEVAHFRGSDGLPLAGILYKPADFQHGKRYPTVIWAHGGPEGQETLTLSPWSLYLAQQGYVVFEPNFRGSTGYGERFRNSNVEDSGGGEIRDIASSVQYLVDQGIADPRRVAIAGGSHGGTIVANAVTKLPNTFAAGIEMFGVVDRALFLQYTNRNSKIRWETKMGGTPAQKPAVYRQANILPDVSRITTPILLLHGEEDPQVPPRESIEFAAALKQNAKVFIYKTYPNEGHGFRQRDHRKDAYERELAFLNQYLH